ncbi:glycosyltransferase family 4 protein [Caldanaerobius fijiensis]|nr:glycosyltransferase family 4 protein [Caldanaerobius fijiensis]
MKIVHIVRTSRGGMLSHVKILLSWLVENGHDVSLIGDFDNDTRNWFQRKGIKVYDIVFNNDSNIFSLLGSAAKIASILKKERPELVHMHGYIASIVGRLACIVNRLQPTVVTIHNYMPDNHVVKKFFVVMEKVLSRWTSVYIAVADALKAYVINQVGIHESKILTIYNGIPYREYEAGVYGQSVPKYVKRVISIARLIPQKGVEYFIRVADDILNMRDNVEFLILGDGPQRDHLESLIKELNRADRIKLLGHRDDVNALLDSSDVFVLPSFSEGMPVSIIEAMRAGKPIVATDVGGIPEEVTDGVNGLLVKPGDAEGLKRAILRFLDDPQYARRCGEKGFELYCNKFSAEKMCLKTQDVYMQLKKANKHKGVKNILCI